MFISSPLFVFNPAIVNKESSHEKSSVMGLRGGWKPLTLKSMIIRKELGKSANPPLALAHDGDDSGGELVEDVQRFIGAGEIGEVSVFRYQRVRRLFGLRRRRGRLRIGEAHSRGGKGGGDGEAEAFASRAGFKAEGNT